MMGRRIPGERIQIIAGPLLPAGGGTAASDGLHGKRSGFVAWGRFEHVAIVDTEAGDSATGAGLGMALGWLSGPAGMAIGAVLGSMAGAFSNRTKLIIAQTPEGAFLLLRCRPAAARTILSAWRDGRPLIAAPSLTERMRAALPAPPPLPSRADLKSLIPKPLRSRFDR